MNILFVTHYILDKLTDYMSLFDFALELSYAIQMLCDCTPQPPRPHLITDDDLE